MRVTALVVAAVLAAPMPSVAADPSWSGRVDEVFAAYDSTHTPGCALGVIRDGALAYARGYGMANLEHGVPIGPDTVFRIGSTSKQFTAMAVLLLDAQGRLALDDDVRRFLPELPETSPPVTIRQLLHHTSGLRDYLTLTWLAGYRDDDYYTDAEVLALLARQRATDFPPGSRHSYSNSGYFLLSQIVLRVTGQSLRQFADSAIFGPLGMSHSHFHDDHTHVVPRRAAGYAPRDGGGFAISQTTLDMVGDGGVFTTIDDLLLWDRNFYDPKVGDAALLQRMQTPGTRSDGEPMSYAMGLVIDDYRGLRRIAHGGAFVGFRAQIVRFPSERTSVAVLCNLASSDPTRLALGVADIVLDDRFPTPLAPTEASASSAAADDSAAPSLTAAERDRWVGAYRHAEQHFIARVEADGETLAIRFPWDERVSLTRLGPSTFADAADPRGIRIEFTDTGLSLRELGRDPSRYERVELAAPRDLDQYAGSYYSPEVDATYRLVVDAGSLRLTNADPRRQAPIDAPLEPTTTDVFQLQYLPLEFQRDETGITGFRLSAGRVKDLWFEKQ